MNTRASFLGRTYLTLLGAIGWFFALETVLFRSGAAEPIAAVLLSVNWLFVLGGYVLVAWIAAHNARTLESPVVGYAGVAVLYDTSDVLHHYPEDRHVAAALELFGSIALLFWYLVQHVADSADV